MKMFLASLSVNGWFTLNCFPLFDDACLRLLLPRPASFKAFNASCCRSIFSDTIRLLLRCGLMDANPFESMRIRVPRQGCVADRIARIPLRRRCTRPHHVEHHGARSGWRYRSHTREAESACQRQRGLFWCPCCSPCVAGSNPTTSSCLPHSINVPGFG